MPMLSIIAAYCGFDWRSISKLLPYGLATPELRPPTLPPTPWLSVPRAFHAEPGASVPWPPKAFWVRRGVVLNVPGEYWKGPNCVDPSMPSCPGGGFAIRFSYHDFLTGKS